MAICAAAYIDECLRFINFNFLQVWDYFWVILEITYLSHTYCCTCIYILNYNAPPRTPISLIVNYLQLFAS